MKKVWPIKLTENAEAAMLLAEEEARAANLTYVGAEHILIALVRVQSGISARAVKELGLEIEQVRHAVAIGERDLFDSSREMMPRKRSPD